MCGRIQECGLDASGSKYGPVMKTYEQGNEIWRSFQKFISQLNEYYLIKVCSPRTLCDSCNMELLLASNEDKLAYELMRRRVSLA
jgi:hypothetical protein